MSIRIVQEHSELSLFFDRPTQRLSRSQLESLRQQLRSVEGVKAVEVQNVWVLSQKVTVVFGAETQPSVMLRRMATALRSCHEMPITIPVRRFNPLKVLRTIPPMENVPDDPFALAHNTKTDLPASTTSFGQILREFFYGILAIASLGMSWVGLLVPGIPTVPFVILTTYFALKASPRLRERLFRSRTFGQMMRDWDEHHAIRRSVKIKAIALTLLLMAVGFALVPPIPALHALMSIMGAIGLFIIYQIPTMESDEKESSVSDPIGNVAPSVA